MKSIEEQIADKEEAQARETYDVMSKRLDLAKENVDDAYEILGRAKATAESAEQILEAAKRDREEAYKALSAVIASKQTMISAASAPTVGEIGEAVAELAEASFSVIAGQPVDDETLSDIVEGNVNASNGFGTISSDHGGIRIEGPVQIFEDKFPVDDATEDVIDATDEVTAEEAIDAGCADRVDQSPF